MLYSLLYFYSSMYCMYCQCVVIPYKSKIHSSDDYYCSGKTLCYFIVHNVILLLIEVDVVRRSLS